MPYKVDHEKIFFSEYAIQIRERILGFKKGSKKYNQYLNVIS